jgi:hypothetical protein
LHLHAKPTWIHNGTIHRQIIIAQATISDGDSGSVADYGCRNGVPVRGNRPGRRAVFPLHRVGWGRCWISNGNGGCAT